MGVRTSWPISDALLPTACLRFLRPYENSAVGGNAPKKSTAIALLGNRRLNRKPSVQRSRYLFQRFELHIVPPLKSRNHRRTGVDLGREFRLRHPPLLSKFCQAHCNAQVFQTVFVGLTHLWAAQSSRFKLLISVHVLHSFPPFRSRSFAMRAIATRTSMSGVAWDLFSNACSNTKVRRASP